MIDFENFLRIIRRREFRLVNSIALGLVAFLLLWYVWAHRGLQTEELGPIVYTKDGSFSVTTSQFAVLERFNADTLAENVADCGIKRSPKYFSAILSNFEQGDEGTEYKLAAGDFAASPEYWLITLIPNKPQYDSLKAFKDDFGICQSGAAVYPYLISEDYLLFLSSCNVGGNIEDNTRTGCDLVRATVGRSLKFRE